MITESVIKQISFESNYDNPSDLVQYELSLQIVGNNLVRVEVYNEGEFDVPISIEMPLLELIEMVKRIQE